MKIHAAVVKERGVTFAVVVVRRDVLANVSQRDAAFHQFSPLFPGLPIILMAQDASGRATYWGRPDIVRFLSSIPVDAIPWREYAVT